MPKRLLILLIFLPRVLCAQFIDNFESGTIVNWEESTNGRWAASDISPITGSYSLHHIFDNVDGDHDQISIALPVIDLTADTTIWRFKVRHGYSPSSSNNWSVFLMSDVDANQMFPSGNPNAYVVGVNLAGYDDLIKIWKLTDGSLSEVLTSTINWQTEVGTSLAAAIEVQRDETGNWLINFNKEGDFENLANIGSGFDNSFLHMGYFGVYYEYSSTQDQVLWIDDISISGEIYVDTIKPYIDSIEILDSNSLKIDFNENIDSTIAINASNYFIDGGIGSPDSVLLGDLQKSARVFFSESFKNKQYYNISIQNIEDLEGNTMKDSLIKFLYYFPEVFDVVINEIMADPYPEINLPNYEYFEIKNNTEFKIDLSGWKIKVGSSERTFTDQILDSAGYITLCSSEASEFLDDYGYVLALSSFPSITNSGTTISIFDENNNFIDSVRFTDNWYGDSEKEDGGWSLERKDPLNTCSTKSNWEASVSLDGGTPGRENTIFTSNIDNEAPFVESLEIISDTQLRLRFNEYITELTLLEQVNYEVNNGVGNPESLIIGNDLKEIELLFSKSFPEKVDLTLSIENLSDECGNTKLLTSMVFLYYNTQISDVVINEIMADPYPEVSLPNYEYVEIKNNTEFKIDLSGWKIKVGSSERTFTDKILDSAGYVTLCSSEASEFLDDFGNVQAFSTFPPISNSGATISIFDENDNFIDSVIFTDNWHTDKEKEEGGWSLERIDPLNTCSTTSNWKSSENPNGGSPGFENSVFASNIDSEAPIIERFEIVSGNQLRLYFNEQVTKTSLLEKINYEINNGIGNPDSLIINNDLKEVDLLYTDIFPEKRNLILTVQDLCDECGNTSLLTGLDFLYYVAQANDIVINELMIDPKPSVELPEFEYIEIYNRSEYIIDLSGWKFIVGGIEKTLPAKSIEEGDYVILCSDVAYPELQLFGDILVIDGFPALPNTGQTIVLRDKQNHIISTISYTDELYRDDYKVEGGWSLERIDPMNACQIEENWIASISEMGGTPGQTNSVNASNPDLESPELLRAGFVDEQHIQLFFSETLDSLPAMQTNVYLVDNSAGNPISVDLIGLDYKSLVLGFSEPFKSNTIYTIEISGGILDCSGNEIDENSTVHFSIPQKIEENDLVINEILFNPYAGAFDFVEIYNRSDKTIDLKEILVASYDDETFDLNSVERIIEESYLIFPGEYKAISEDIRSVQEQYITSNYEGFIQVRELPSYNDDKGWVMLLDKRQVRIDYLEFNEDMHFSLLASYEGVSLERINYDRPSNDKTNWHSASEHAGFATPAYENSQFMELEDMEEDITIEPEVFSPDNDGFDDVANINFKFNESGYVANIKIFDSKGRLIRYLANNLLLGVEGAITWDGLDEKNQKVSVGIYVVFIEVYDLDGNVRQYKKAITAATKW